MKKTVLAFTVAIIALVGLSANKCEVAPTFNEPQQTEEPAPVEPTE